MSTLRLGFAWKSMTILTVSSFCFFFGSGWGEGKTVPPLGLLCGTKGRTRSTTVTGAAIAISPDLIFRSRSSRDWRPGIEGWGASFSIGAVPMGSGALGSLRRSPAAASSP